MKRLTTILLFLFSMALLAQEGENGDYIEFNDRSNVLHGVYLGLNVYYGEIDGRNTYHGGFKVAYVANKQLEVGFAAVGFYSEQNFDNSFFETLDLAGAYGGLHIEPILFGRSKVNMSFPLLVGSGAVFYIEDVDEDVDLDRDDVDVVFVAEPGVSLLYNPSRFVQLELGVRYRFSSRVELNPSNVKNINGFSAGFGIKLGVFNMGRNRYKKQINN